MRDRLKAEGVHNALQRTLWKRKPFKDFIWPTDQGHLGFSSSSHNHQTASAGPEYEP